MNGANCVSQRKAGVRSVVIAILVMGTSIRSLTSVMVVAGLVYVALGTAYLFGVARGDDESAAEVLLASGPLVRRWVVWIPIALTVTYLLLIDPAPIRGAATIGCTYLGGLAFQSVREREQGAKDMAMES